MCGLAGFIGFKDNKALAEEANKIQQHRGPDNQSIWADDYIALAHQRLSIIDLNERSNQPFHKGDLVIIFNGEIYNYKELTDQLVKEKNVVFTTTSDTEVVLEIYNCYREQGLDMLVGMFAFAIYNKVTSSLFIARDHFGIKPLFYMEVNGSFAFASELKTLIKVPGFNKTINSKSLVSSLNYLWVSGNETMFDDCFKLPPAHYLLYSPQQGPSIVRYWKLNDQTAGPVDEKKLADQIAEGLEASVNRHIIADVPVSSFLSGGLDSSLIAVIAKRTNTKLSTYTISTSAKDNKAEKMSEDENYANIVAGLYGLDHNVIKISPDIIKDLPEMVRTLDEPIGDPAAINTYRICKAAREKGVKVLLSGMGADEIFFGYRRQKATLLAMNYNRLPGLIKRTAAAFVSRLPVTIMGKGFKFGRWAKRFLTFVSMPVDLAYMRSYSYYSNSQLQELLTAEHWNAIGELNQEHKAIFNASYKDDTVNRICYTDINMFMLGLNLTYTDRASMAASVEVRVPFIDKLFITQAMQVPGSLKIKHGISKYILKKAAERFLPEKIIYRAKASFGAPIRSWISNDLRAVVDELLSEANIKKRGFLNYAFVRKLIEDDRKGLEDNAYQIYHLLTLELWCKEFLDK